MCSALNRGIIIHYYFICFNWSLEPPGTVQLSILYFILFYSYYLVNWLTVGSLDHMPRKEHRPRNHTLHHEPSTSPPLSTSPPPSTSPAPSTSSPLSTSPPPFTTLPNPHLSITLTTTLHPPLHPDHMTDNLSNRR